MTVGQRIAQLRKQNGLSQEALGTELGVSRQAISKWESDAALPEIEKLIALSKRFCVPVGYLLGVEEKERMPSEVQSQSVDGATEGCTAGAAAQRTEAEVLERYLHSLPRPKAVSKRNKILLAVTAALLVVVVTGRMVELRRGLTEAGQKIQTLQQTMAQLEGRFDGLSNELSNQVEQAMQQEYGLLANWELYLTEIDYDANLGEVELRAVLKHGVEDASQLRFYAEGTDKTITEAVEHQWDGENCIYTAKVQLPLTEANAVYYLTTPDGTVCIAGQNEHPVTNLAELTQPTVELSLTQTSDRKRVRLGAGASVYVPSGMEEVLTLAPPQVSMWLATEQERLSPLPVRFEESSTQPFLYDMGVEGPVHSFAPYQNERLFVEYEITFGNGYQITGRSSQTWAMGPDGIWGYGEELPQMP